MILVKPNLGIRTVLFAISRYLFGMTLYDVKEILGHSNIRTTERYAHLSNSRLRQAAGAVSTFYDNQDWIGDVPDSGEVSEGWPHPFVN